MVGSLHGRKKILTALDLWPISLRFKDSLFTDDVVVIVNKVVRSFWKKMGLLWGVVC